MFQGLMFNFFLLLSKLFIIDLLNDKNKNLSLWSHHQSFKFDHSTDIELNCGVPVPQMDNLQKHEIR